nr:PREDICTED: leucine-rich repeat-containing protein 66 isoform X1 [Rhinolophus sinicus]XP_019596580.1 PREDICTED: leucine-rich repeat-containing protein 66 isoform X1 [Rhinolophus sinicus]XP_019596581.1 PREDICTED: leucine-rich repeat-containing protein 66 isoform X1 [Rhinolophus sinicus]
MKNLCFTAITMAIGLYFTGTMANPARKSSISFNSECQWNGYLLTNCSFPGKHAIPMDISQTAATVDVSSNFFKILLQSPTKKEEWNIKHLDLSNNLISKITLSRLAHLQALELLNLSNNAIRSLSFALPSPKSSSVKRHRSSLRNRLPLLKLLILQRNKLSDIPKGLWKLKSLQSLDLSFNRISQIGVSDFHNCLQLENLYLKSNKIFRIHPKAFKDLKKLQAVDLSNNALTTILPIMIIALELPHLEADLADNKWQCDGSVAVFQNFLSESWKKKWNVICNKTIGNEEAYWWTPRSRIPRKSRIPHTHLNHRKSLRQSKAERHQEGMYISFSTPGEKDHASSDTSEPLGRLSRWVRSVRDEQTADGKEAAPQNFALAICLAVFITFFVAFCLGALTRPYVDRLWQQRCWHRSSGSDHAYSNEGFYDEMEAAENTRHAKVDPRQACHELNLCENQDPFWGTEARPHAAVIADRNLGRCRKESGSQQNRERCGDHTGAGSREDIVLPNDSTSRSILHGQPNTDTNALIAAGQDRSYKNVIPGEINYDTVSQEDSLCEHSVGIPALAGRSQTDSGSNRKDWNELDPTRSSERTAALSEMQTHTQAQRIEKNKEREHTEQLPPEFSKETQVSTSISVLSPQQQRLKGAIAEEELSTYYSSVTLSNAGDMDLSPPVFPPGWGSDLATTPTNEESVQKHTPDTQYELDTNYESDEGSLFTLSSVSSEDARNVAEEDTDGKESCRASEPLEDEDSEERKDSVTSFENLEDSITFQKIQGKCENQEDHFEKPLISRPDSGLCESHLESASNTNKCDTPLTSPGSLGKSPSADETPDMLVYDCVTAPWPEAAEWLRSLSDLEFFTVDNSPQTPPCSAEVPSEPDQSAHRERDSDFGTCEPFIQETDTAQNSVLFQITTGETVRPSQQDSEGCSVNSNPLDIDASEGFVCSLENYDSREAISQTQLSEFFGDEPALQCDRRGGEYFEEDPKSQVPLLQELPNKTSSLRTQEPFSDRDGRKYSEENMLQ